MSLFVDRLAQRLAGAAPAPAPTAPTPEGVVPKRRAAVAAVLHDEPGGPRVLMMKRAERAGDPWSGHISLPGGGYEPGDVTLLATAIRETREELDVDLTAARLVGNLEPMHPRTTGPLSIQVTPFIFATDTLVEPHCGPEALAAFWLPLDLAASGALDGTYTYPGLAMAFPSWTYEGHIIWGLTWRILSDLILAAG